MEAHNRQSTSEAGEVTRAKSSSSLIEVRSAWYMPRIEPHRRRVRGLGATAAPRPWLLAVLSVDLTPLIRAMSMLTVI